MKKLIVLSLISLATFIPQLHSISLEEYSKRRGGVFDYDVTLDGVVLNLSNKNLTDINGLRNIPGINQVDKIDLSRNQLQELPADIFSGLNNLKELRLGYNPLKTLPENIFNGLHNLEELEFFGIPFQGLPANIFDDLNNLKTLGLTVQHSPSFIAQLMEIIHNIPNDGVMIKLSPLPGGGLLKHEAIKQLARLTHPHFLRNLPSDILDLLSLTKEERKEIERGRVS